MSTAFPVSPAMSRRNLTLSPSTLSQLNASFGPEKNRQNHPMNRASKTTTGGYASTKGDTEVEDGQMKVMGKKEVQGFESNHPLMEELATLTASCEAHEREIRVSTTTIKRQLQDWSQNFDTLNELDNQAERMTAYINHLTLTTQTEHSQMISTVIEQPERTISAQQPKLEPWKSDLFEDEEEEDLLEADPSAVAPGGIPRIKRDKAPMDGLAKLEYQASNVNAYYEAEEARLNALVQAKWVKRRLFTKILSFTSTAVVLVSIIIWLLLWTFEWR